MRSCSAITTRAGGWSMQAASAAASTPPSLQVCGGGCSRSPRTRCRFDLPPPRSTRFGSPLVLSRVALGPPQARRRGQVPHLDRGQTAAPGRLSGPARGQAGERSSPRSTEPESRTVSQTVTAKKPVARSLGIPLRRKQLAEHDVDTRACRPIARIRPLNPRYPAGTRDGLP